MRFFTQLLQQHQKQYLYVFFLSALFEIIKNIYPSFNFFFLPTKNTYQIKKIQQRHPDNLYLSTLLGTTKQTITPTQN